MVKTNIHLYSEQAMTTRKLFIGIGLIAVVVVALYLTMNTISNPKIPLEWSLSSFTIPINWTESLKLKLTVYLPIDYTILYNCHVEVRYFAKNNIWKTVISQDLGTLRYPDDTRSFTIYLDTDFKNSSRYYYHNSLTFWFNQTVNAIDIATQEPNFKADIYGFQKP